MLASTNKCSCYVVTEYPIKSSDNTKGTKTHHKTKFVFWALALPNIIQEYLHLKLLTKARNVANLFSVKLSHHLIRPLTHIITASTPINVAHYKLSYHDNFGRCIFFFYPHRFWAHMFFYPYMKHYGLKTKYQYNSAIIWKAKKTTPKWRSQNLLPMLTCNTQQ
jgi:hypothetical protein